MDSYADQKSRELDFKHCMLYMLDHLLLALAVGIVFAASFAGYSYIRQKNASDKQKVFEQIVANNRGAYYPVSGKTVINSERGKIDGTCIVRGEIFVDYDLSSVEGMATTDYSTMISRFNQDLMIRMVSDKALGDITNEINSRSYSDVENVNDLTVEDIRWLINMTFTGANIMQYSVTDISTQRAIDISELLKDAFLEEAKSYETINSARLLEAPAVFFDDTNNQGGVSMGSLIKIAAVGGVLGMLLVFGICFIVFLAVDSVRTSSDLEFLGLDVYGMIPKKNELRAAEYKRIAYGSILKNDCEKILIVPVDKKTDISEIVTNVNKELADRKNGSELIEAESISQSPEALLAAKDADGVVLAATYGVSLMKDLAYAKSEMSKTGKQIAGVIVNGCKHR